MIKYCFIKNEETGLVQIGAGCTDEYYEEIGMEKRNVDQSDIDYQWYLFEKCPHKSEEEKQREREGQERKRRESYNMTKLDFVKAVKPYGVTYEAIKVLLASSPEAQMEWDCCERVYRYNETLERMVGQFGMTSQDLDKIFKVEVGND